MSEDRGAGLRLFVLSTVLLYWAYFLSAEHVYGPSKQLESCKVDRAAHGGSSWNGATGPLGVLVTLLSCQIGETTGVLVLAGVIHAFNTYMALNLAATALAHLCPGSSTEDLSTREWRSCAVPALAFGCHPAVSALLSPSNPFARHHGLGVLFGTTLALNALTARLEAHWRWDNAYSVVSPALAAAIPTFASCVWLSSL